jgi:hypothetical protein
MRWPHHAPILAGYALGVIALAAGLPAQMPPAATVPGYGTVWLGATMAAFLLPTALAVTDALLRRLAVTPAHGDSPASGVLAIYDAMMWRLMLFVMGVHGTVLLALLGKLRGRPWAAQIVPVMLGVTMIGIGNLLPRLRPNLAVGIRTRRTLSDRGVRRRDGRVHPRRRGVRGAEALWSGNGPGGGAGGRRRDLASGPVFHATGPWLKPASGARRCVSRVEPRGWPPSWP